MDKILNFLYGTVPGRILLKGLTARPVSKAAGAFMDSAFSIPLIRPFVKKNGIDLSECETADFRCFNDCFTRKLKPEVRPVDREGNHLISPCDGLLRVWPVQEGLVLPVKESRYSVADLLGPGADPAPFQGGQCLVFRLCVHHYHRYCYFDSGRKGENIFLPGRLHTVQPIALRSVPVFTENCREVTRMETDHFGSAVQIEVGAMLVGKIRNHHGAGPMTRGDEKGMFLYGGSTIIVLLPAGSAELDPAILRASAAGEETPVRLGERIGTGKGSR